MHPRLSILLLSGLLLTACSGVPIPEPIETPTEASEEDTDTNPTLESSMEIAYIAMGDNGASGPLVGCGDSEILTTVTVTGNVSVKERIKMALENLFSNKDQFLGESGLYNALYQSTLTVDSVTIEDGTVEVEISGETMSGGECDDPRMVEQIRGTVENNIDSDRKMTVIINLNGKPLEKLQDLSGQ